VEGEEVGAKVVATGRRLKIRSSEQNFLAGACLQVDMILFCEFDSEAADTLLF